MTQMSNNHEYILAYAKVQRIENRRLKESNAQAWFNSESFAFLPKELDQSRYDNPDNDPRGPWKADPFDAPNYRPNLTYPIKTLIQRKYLCHLEEDIGELKKVNT